MCSRCGAVLRASGASHSPTLDILSERRPVTALFCDLVDSVALTMRLDAEEMLDVLGAYHAACDETVPKFGGYITQYMGDGILAYFGYPSAGEDDAANAVSAAIALRDRIKRLDLPSGISLHSRIGVATGVVAINIPRGQAEGRKANLAGMAPNVAARLQSIAPPDGIIIDSTTRRITGGRFTCRDGGRVALKGFQDSVEVFEVIGAATGVSRFQARSPDGTAPLAGREAEFNLLLAGWSRVQAGTGEVIVVQGEPGIGKSRIVDALRQHLAVGQILQMSWYCAPDRSDSALHPVIEHLSHRAGISPGDSPVRRGEKLDAVMDRSAVTDARGRAELKALLGVPPDPLPPEPMTSERRREVLLQTLLGMVDRLAGTGPALLVLEDLHWADSTTLELLDRSRRLAADRPWLMVCTCRQDFDVRKNLGDGASQIQLNRLAHGNADRIVAHIDHEQRLSAEARRQIVARSDGIPLFVEEMTKAVLEALADAPAAAVHLDDVIPQTLQASLTARLDRLGPARRIATVAAAIGRRFTYELLSAVVAHPPVEVDADLHALVRSGLVEPLGDAPATAYLFKHALIREAAYESLLKREREDLHGRIAAALRTRFTGMHAAEPELLAYHLTRSGALEEAVSLWQAAGERAAAAGAHVEAAAHLTTALDLLRRSASVESRTRTELRLLRGLVVSLAMTRGYSAPEAGKAAAEARAICDRLDDPEEQCGILINYCGFSVVAGDIAATEDMAGRCMRMAEQTGHIRHRISSACAFGLAKFVRGEFAAAEHHLGVAIELYNRNDGRHLPRVTAQDSLTVCYSAVPLIRWAAGDGAGADRAAEALLAHARSLGESFDLTYSLCWLALFEISRGNRAAALPLAREAFALSVTYDFGLWRAIAALEMILAGSLSQEPASAIASALAAMAAIDRIGLNLMRGFYWSEIARLHQDAGNTPAALRTIDDAISYAERSGEKVLLSRLFCRKADILAATGGVATHDVVVALEMATAVARMQGAPGFAALAAAQLADLRVPAGDPA